MFMNAVVSIFAALLLSASTMVDARVVPRDVITPPVLYPTNGTQWFIGQRHNVTWYIFPFFLSLPCSSSHADVVVGIRLLLP